MLSALNVNFHNNNRMLQCSSKYSTSCGKCTQSVRSHSMRKWNGKCWCWCQGAAAAKHECCIQPHFLVDNSWEKNPTHLNSKATFNKPAFIQWISFTYEASLRLQNSRIPKSSRWKMSWCSWRFRHSLIVWLNDGQSWWNGYKDPSFVANVLCNLLCLYLQSQCATFTGLGLFHHTCVFKKKMPGSLDISLHHQYHLII